MSTLIKEEEGLIYDEYFHSNQLLWSLTPSNIPCISFELDGLHIKHNEHYVMYTMKEMEDEYCVVTQIQHTPLTEEDIGGLIVFSDNNNYAECQTYLATSPSTIGNNGMNVNAGYDLSARYVRYSFDDEDGSESTDSSSSSDTVINPTTGFHDTIYQFLKIIKYNNSNINHTYQFFASHDGFTWIEVGNVDYDRNNSIGFFLYSTQNQNLIRNGNFIVNSFYIYKQKDIEIKGINISQDFEIFDSHLNKTILRSDIIGAPFSRAGNRVIINTTNLMVPWTNAWLRLYPKHRFDQLIAQYPLDNLTFGGDVFSINYDVQLRIDNEIIQSGTTYDLGTLFTHSFKRNIVVYNNDDVDLHYVKVSIIAFSEYYNGEEVVEIAIYDGNNDRPEIHIPDNEYDYIEGLEEHYQYTKELLIPHLYAHTGIELIMKLSDVPKQAFYSTANKYRFKMVIE